jgi:hypothetical protein
VLRTSQFSIEGGKFEKLARILLLFMRVVAQRHFFIFFFEVPIGMVVVFFCTLKVKTTFKTALFVHF